MHRRPGRPPRLPIIHHQETLPVYFVTLCIHDRQPILANPSSHTAFQEFARRGHDRAGIAVGRYVLMPDHLHLFVCGPAEFDLSQWVRMLKRNVTPTPRCWQRGFFDHLLRSEESYAAKWEYVLQNPVRAGLVQRPADWPYQGEIVVIDRV